MPQKLRSCGCQSQACHYTLSLMANKFCKLHACMSCPQILAAGQLYLTDKRAYVCIVCRSGQQQWVVTPANDAEFTYYINAYAGRPCGSSYLAAGGTCSSQSTKCQLTDPRTAASAVLQVLQCMIMAITALVTFRHQHFEERC